MSHALAILALHAASAATQRAHDTLRALGAFTAADHVKQAGTLISTALGLIIIDNAHRMREQERTS